MRVGLPISLVLHSGLIAAGLMVLPTPKLAIIDTPEIVPVDLVTLAEETNVRALEPEPEPEPEITPLPAPPETAPAPEPEPEKIVTLPPEPEPEQKPKPVKKETTPKPKPVKQARPRKKPRPKAPVFDLARLESKLARQAPGKTGKPPGDSLERARAAIGAGDAMTASEIDLLRAQMYKCWRAPLDAPYPEKLKVTVRARLNPDGTLSTSPEILNQGEIRRSGDPFWQAAADNARRAVLKCQPYTLPADKYALWRETIMSFNPSDVLGN